MRQDGRNYLKSLREFDLSQEFKCINALQEVPYMINENTIEIIKLFWQKNHAVGGLPSRENLELQPYPFDRPPEELSESEQSQFRDWKKSRKEIYDFNNRTTSKRIQIERTLQVADRYRQYDAFWFAWSCDFRSRKYAVSDQLSPQGADWSKGLLTFAEGVPIQHESDAQWLAIHGANCYGVDKVPLIDRELWAYMNEDNVVRTVENPLDYTWWLEADEPWQFLAWCYEWYGYLRQGLGFITHLPCAADGSCNGLQHLSALNLDERGGKAVNLTPSDSPQDIYTDVAEETTARLRADAATGNEFAKMFLKFGIDRKITKRSVMIVPYSGTLFACKDYIQDAVKEKLAGEPAPWADNENEALAYLARQVWASISTVITAASSVMDYLKQVGKVCAKQDKAMEWVTPTGFLVRQAYPNLEKKRIKTHIDGSTIKLNYQSPIDNSISKHRATNGASPNYIHSLDASALTLTVNKCYDQGIRDFAMVHDSYGTHSPNMPLLSNLLREAFVEMYTSSDLLEDLRTYVFLSTGEDVGPAPSKGSLDIHKVLESKYFFA